MSNKSQKPKLSRSFKNGSEALKEIADNVKLELQTDKEASTLPKSHKINTIEKKEITEIEEEIEKFLGKIQNKYSGNAEQKHLNQMYDIGILISNRKHNRQKMATKIAKIVEERSADPIKLTREHKRHALLEALQKGIEDGTSETYRNAYDNSSKYSYDKDRLETRAHIDKVLNIFHN